MQTRTNVNWVFVATLCLSVSFPGFAADRSPGLEQVLRPCIDDQTFAVIRLDVEKLDLDALVGRALDLVGKHAGPDVAKSMQRHLKDRQVKAGAEAKDFLKAGGRDIFLVFSMYDFPYFFVAIPIHSANDRGRLHRHIREVVEKDFNIGDEPIYVSDRLILVGLERTSARLKTTSPVRSEALAAGFQACANKTAQVVLFPSSDQRRILAEMMPQMPLESGTTPPATISQDLQWAALGFDCPPSISLSLTIQSPSVDGADRMLTLVKGLYILAGQHPEVRRLFPELAQLLKRLTPRRQGDRLSLQVDSAAADSLIDDIVAPSLVRVHEYATRMACGTNMSGIGKALLIYSNDYNDELPPDLETLIHTVEMTPKGLICPATGLRESYVYRGAGLTTSAPHSMITVYEKAGHHGGDGRNVVFLDSSVKWVKESRFQELIEKDNEYRRKKGLPVLPAQ
ncbi:MAG: hypothetical protein GQ528_09290 [Woeseiaceae bacterium]|nr:hypothetical protein [Woeseiaceae bacterium]